MCAREGWSKVPHSLDQFQALIDAILQDGASKLTDAVRGSLIGRAIQRYSKDRPREIVTDVSASGTPDQALPTGSGATFEDGFSEVEQLEYPVGNVPATILLSETWALYSTPSGLVIRMYSAAPSAGQTIRVTWTARHASDGSTIPDQDFEAVCEFGASLGYAALAAVYAQTGDASIGADTINYRTKGQEYLALAKAAQKRYFDHLGIPQDQVNAETGPAIAIGSLREEIGLAGIDRLTHPKATR